MARDLTPAQRALYSRWDRVRARAARLDREGLGDPYRAEVEAALSAADLRWMSRAAGHTEDRRFGNGQRGPG
jgi:hypothetical protein